jgi:23S rRNA pseudouridine2604 synthase
LRCRASGVPLVLRLLWADGWCFRGGRAGAQGDEDLSAAGCARAGVWRAACAAARGGRATRRAACCSAAACAPRASAPLGGGHAAAISRARRSGRAVRVGPSRGRRRRGSGSRLRCRSRRLRAQCAAAACRAAGRAGWSAFVAQGVRVAAGARRLAARRGRCAFSHRRGESAALSRGAQSPGAVPRAPRPGGGGGTAPRSCLGSYRRGSGRRSDGLRTAAARARRASAAGGGRRAGRPRPAASSSRGRTHGRRCRCIAACGSAFFA